MNRQGPSACKPCCCKNHSTRNSGSRYTRIQEEIGVNEDDYFHPDANIRTKRNFYCTNAQQNDPYNAIDGPTLNTLASLRQKACQFLRSESECSEVSSHQSKYPSANQCRGSNLLRQANNLIDYNPQSEFLKKMKQQCQFLQNDQPNIFSTLDNCEEFIPHECQKCIEKTKRILTLGDQIRCNKFKSPTEGVIRGCNCRQQLAVNDLDDNRMVLRLSARGPRDAQYYSGANDFDANQRIMGRCNVNRLGDDVNEKILQKPSEEARANEKISEHQSRSKKPVKCRGRRKRKSTSSEKCESDKEPNLKRPHENSCERCWRYASPSRSPVNKPEQRYDPNFRRGHSCIDFTADREDGDLEITGKHTSPCKNLQPIISREKVSSVSPTRISQASRMSPETSSQKTQFCAVAQQKTPNVCETGQQVPQTVQFTHQKNQYSSQKSQCIPQQPQNQIKQDGSFTKVKELMYNYSRSKSPEKNLPKSQPSESERKSPKCQGILQSDSGRKPRPKSCTTDSHTLSPNTLPSYLLDATEYYDLCAQPKERLGHTGPVGKMSVPGNRTQCGSPLEETSPAKVGTPKTVNKVNFSLRVDSVPKQGNLSKTGRSPDSNGKADLKTNKNGSFKSKSPKSPANLNLDFSAGTDSTAYAEISNKKNSNSCSPKKSSSPKNNSKKGKSSRKGKTSPKRNLREVHSSSDFQENIFLNQNERPQTVFEPGRLPVYAPVNDQYIGSHPIRDCWCPPRAPFIRGNANGNTNENPEHIFCCHCNWEEIMKDQQQCEHGQNERRNAELSEMSDRQFMSEGTSSRRRESPQRNAPPRKNLIRLTEEMEMNCPYRAFQMEKRAVNDTSWENDYQNLKEYCLRNPEQFNYRVSAKTKNPFKPSEYVPTKYALFYMTQNERDKGGDVEVLVEELTQNCPNTNYSRTKDITDKMKRITDCPTDSMALRFQKGVSDSCRTPQSSRILYF